ncbi:MAG: metallopeptidase family protein [Lentisphaerae bacterium]|nr:metallopeptidase family protein [Lentisphaerota bacterium]
MIAPTPKWSVLLRMAEEEVSRVLRGLPAPLRRQAQGVPVQYEEWPTAEQAEDGADMDLMGLFVGIPFPEMESGVIDVPAQIFLFLRNIWDEGEGVERRYREEVRTTYLHEVGHYLGLEEDDLEARGLE